MMRFHKTRFDDGDQRLLYAKQGENFWRFFHQEGDERPGSVGPFYPTEKALLAGMEDYGREFGFDTCFNKLYLVADALVPPSCYGKNYTDSYDAFVICAANAEEALEIARQGRSDGGLTGSRVITTRLGVADNDTPKGPVLGSWNSTG